MTPAPLTLTSLEFGGPAAATGGARLQEDFARRLKEDFNWLPIPWVRAADDWMSWHDGGHSPVGPRIAFGTPADRKGGRSLPLFWSELDLRAHRVMARWLCDTNPFAIGFSDRLTDYHIRKGYGWQACLRGQRKTPYATAGAGSDPVVVKAQNILDAWRDANRWPIRSGEAFKRWRRDGEVFGRFFRGGWDRLAAFRFIEPEQVGSPTGDTSGNTSFGIETDPEDVETQWAYYVWALDDSGEGEWVDADVVIHAKCNTDSTVKRGIPDFYPVYQNLEHVRRLIDTLLLTSIRQASVAWREKFKQALGSVVSGIVPAGPGAGSNPPEALNLPWWAMGQGRAGNRMPPGTVQRTEGDREFADGPAASGVGNFLQAEQAALRACCLRWGFPEYTGSADASNNNFASSLVAGSPFSVAVERKQLEWGAHWEKPVALKVLDLAVEAGLLTAAERARLDVEVVAPSVVTPEPEKEAETLTSLLTAKVICLDTVRQKLGYDPQHEAEGVKADAAAQQPAAPANPPAPGGGPEPVPAAGKLAAVFGESIVTALLREHGFTGTDKRGVRWVDGVPQKKAGDAGGGDKTGTGDTGGSGKGTEKVAGDTLDALAAEFPNAAKQPGLWGKVKDLAHHVSLKVGTFLLNHEKTIGAVASLVDAAMTTPDDIAKNPALAGKFGSHGDTSGDAATAATKDMLGVGIPPTVIARLAATAILKAWGLAKSALGLGGKTESDNLDLAADFLVGLFGAAGVELDPAKVRAMLAERIKTA